MRLLKYFASEGQHAILNAILRNSKILNMLPKHVSGRHNPMRPSINNNYFSKQSVIQYVCDSMNEDMNESHALCFMELTRYYNNYEDNKNYSYFDDVLIDRAIRNNKRTFIVKFIEIMKKKLIFSLDIVDRAIRIFNKDIKKIDEFLEYSSLKITDRRIV